MNVVKFPLWYRRLLILPAAILSNFPFTPAVGLTRSSFSLENALLESYSVFESLQSDEDLTGYSEYRLTQVITPAADGTGTLVAPAGNQFNINGGTVSGDGVNLFHSFEKFGLDAGQIANFLSNPEIRNILSRVVGGDASIINGLIQVTGGTSNLFLMNPAGIIFGPNASLNLPGDFTATTANGIQFGENWFNAAGLNNYEILVGNPTGFAFTMTHPGSVINLGTLAVEPGQNLTLLGGSVINNGQLSAPAGQVIVNAVPGENFVRISQEGQLLNLEIRPITPDSNRPHQWSLPITALPDLLTQGASGYDMEAQVNPDGTIALVVEDTTIPVHSGTVVASGRLESTGETGGTVGIFGERVGVIAAEIDVSGTQDGGTVLIGGEYKGQGDVPTALRTIVDQNSIINADALLNGNGGRVIVWADEATGFYGQVNARGGNEAGNGGFVEVSGKEYLDFQGNVDTSAMNGNFGTLLLDPISIEIIEGEGNTTDVNLSSEDTPENATLSADTINNSTTNIFLEATDDITFNADIDLREPEIGMSAESTTINVNNTITTAGGNLNFTANTIVVPETGSLNANGGTIALTGDNIQLGENRISPEDGEKKLIQSEGGELIIQPRTFNQIVLGDDTENNPQALEITEEELSTLSNNFNQIEIILESGDIFIDGDPPGVEFFEVKFLSPVRIEARNGSIIAREDRTIRAEENASILIEASDNIEVNDITVDRTRNDGSDLTLTALGDNSTITTGTAIITRGDVVISAGQETSNNGSNIILGDIDTNGGNLTVNAFGNNSSIETVDNFPKIQGESDLSTNGGIIILNAPSGNINIVETIGESSPNGFAGDITIISGGVTRFNDVVLANSITTDAGGTTQLNANVTTINNQTYNDVVTLTNDVILNSSAGNGNIAFNSTLNGNSNLQLNSGSGTITLGEVGDQNPLSSLTLNTTGQTNLGGNINVRELNINQPNIQLTSDVVINVSSGTTGIDFGGGTVNGNFNLELIAGDNNIILGTVGENQPLSSLTANSSGLTTLAGNIITSGIDGVNFSDVTELNLINNINIDTSSGNGVINLEGGTIDGDFNLNLNAGSGEISLGQVGSNTPLNLLNIPTAGAVNLNGNLTTVGNIDFTNITGGTQINADIIITSNNGNISFNGSPISGEGNTLTLDTQNEVFLDNVGNQGEELGGLIVDNAETVNLFGNIFTDGGIQFPTVTTVNLNGDLITLETDSDNGNIDFSNALVIGDSQLTINAGTGNINLGQVGTETNELGGLTIESATDINLSGDIFTKGGLDFSGTETVNLNVAEVRLQTRSDNGDINLSNTLVTGNSELTLNAGEAGEISLENVGNFNQPLESLILESAANVNLSGSIFTKSDLDFSGVPTVNLLGTNVVLQTLDNNGSVNLANSSINAVGEGVINLTINTENGQVDLGVVGNQTPISSLTVNTTGQTTLGGNITTSGTVNFSEASNVDLISDVVIDSSSGNGNINLDGGNIDGEFDLDLNTNSGNITLLTVGSNIPLNNLTVNSTGTTSFNSTVNTESLVTNAGGITQINDNITTTGVSGQTYGDRLILSNNLILTGDEINFREPVSGNNFDLTLQHFSLNRSISLGNTATISNSLNLTETELSLLQNGFNSLTLGSAATGQINILGNISFNDPVILRSGLDSIQAINFTLNGTDNASLSLEANQDITVGDILNPNRSINLTTANGSITARNLVGNPINLTTQGGDITLSPSEDLNLINPTILTNGGDFSINSSSVIQLSGSGQVETAGGNITFDGTDIFNTIPLNTSNTSGQGGTINLTAQTGVVTTDDLNSSGATGGAITVDAVITITAGEINSSGSIGNGGNVSLDPEEDIEVEWIDSQGGANGRGGDVFISTERFFRATGSFIDQNGIEASISTSGGQGGGSVTLRHAGGPLRDPRSFFTVGANLTENGTAAAITTGEFTIGSPNAFEGSFRLGNISIETDDLIPSFLLENEINPPNNQSNISLNNQPAPQQEQSRILSDIIPKKDAIDPLDIATNLPCVPIDAGVMAIEQGYTQEFAEYWGISTDDAVKSLVDTCNALQDIAGITGVKPGVIYVNFVPVGYELTTDQSSLEIHSLDRTQPQRLPPDQETDELEITLVTAEGQPIRKRISGVTRATVLEGVRQFREDLLRSGNGYLSSGQELYQWLIAPIEAHLQTEEIENLVFIMDEGLRSLPIAALHDGEQFLIEKYSVGLAPSLTLTETRYSSLKQAQVLAMGTAQFTNLRPLPAVPVELSMIFKTAWQGELFLNEQFTISNLNTQRNQTPFGIVHLGTHADFNAATPDNSYIQFWDERLRLDQVRDLNFNQPPVKLLVLSACKTLLGNREAELGFAGFAAKAGVESVLASLWSVDDKGTLPLMVEFYEQLATAPIKAEALRQAQIAMLRGEIQYESDLADTGLRERLVLPNLEAIPLPPELAESGVHELSHPFYWAAFTLVGSPW